MERKETRVVGGGEDTKTERRTYIWPYLGEHKVNVPADNVVTPCLVVVSIGLLRQDRHAFLDTLPLCVRPGASELSNSAEKLDALHLVLRIRY